MRLIFSLQAAARQPLRVTSFWSSEVNPVLRTLRQQGIEVTALHSHMVDETPRMYFMHFWANDDAVKLAKALRGALDKTNSKHGG